VKGKKRVDNIKHGM